jgi:tetratricopeptide (TPR) repeat protein
MAKFLKYIIFVLLFAAAQFGESLAPLEDRWALVIGISQYRDNTFNLEFADKDADAIAGALTNQCRFPQNHIKLLKNADATYENIRRGVEGWLAKNTNKDDKVVIFFSGHGTQDLDDNNDELDGYDEFLVPYDFDDTDISSAIRDDTFSYWINNLKSENVLILFDSCYSGGAAKAKGFNHIKVKGKVLVDGFIKDIFKEVPKAGVALLAACKDHQYSFEAPEFGMGLFTYSLINSFKQNNDRDNDQSLDINELFAPTEKFVIDYSIKTYKEEQTPVLISTLKLPFKLVYIPQAKPVTPDKFVQESKNIYFQAMGARDKQRKIELLEEGIKYDPHNFSAYKLLADTFLELGESEKAIHFYELALVDSPSKGFLYFDLSKAYEHVGNFTLAFQYIRLALDISEDTRNLNQLARLYSLNSDYNNAIKYYLKSIEVNPRDYEAHFELARVYIQQEQYDQALSVLNAAININLDSENLYYLKGVLMYYVKNNINEAMALYKKFSDMDALFSSIISLFKIDKKGWVIDNLSILDRKGFVAEYYMCAILSYEENKNTNKAKEYYERLKTAYPFFKDANKYKELQRQIK